jgi:hypothetical protein
MFFGFNYLYIKEYIQRYEKKRHARPAETPCKFSICGLLSAIWLCKRVDCLLKYDHICSVAFAALDRKCNFDVANELKAYENTGE